MALPDYSQYGFYNPGQTYRSTFGSGPGMKQTAPGFYQTYGSNEAAPDVYALKLTQMGLGETSARAKAAKGLYGQVQSGYKQAVLNSNSELQFPEYLEQIQLDKLLANQSFEQQGMNPRQFQGRYRWGLRAG